MGGSALTQALEPSVFSALGSVFTAATNVTGGEQ